MTPEQRYDLAIEWRLTSNRMKEIIKEEYNKKYGTNTSDEQWESYLIKALNIESFWKSVGLM
ncbi:hypothetical protein [Desulfopila aestuarii]|uniref:Uncharacterized protein n=1 Tax=Desulfopila aestuarii DSM 18488 TaxID=1121416 RepID=A0A1M7YCN4_9BACT|nr:hypothetical protein [Desulfopila aestuarii]SHO50400.1 hypothetical protein SAMN02745220_03403 [Desulfopila aestuarii DSM 18488]